MPRLTVAVLVAGALILQGCVTKHYGRQLPLAEGSKAIMGCADIDAEIARVRKFKDDVDKEGPDLEALMTDFGIGDLMEKKEALESADRRLAQLAELKKAKQCDAPR